MSSIFLTSFWDFVLFIVIVGFLAMVIWMFITVFVDILGRHDLSGIAKAFWIFLIFILPLIGILIYFIGRPPKDRSAFRWEPVSAEREEELIATQRSANWYSASGEIEKAQQLLAAGSITQADFDDIKAKALAAE